MFQQIHLMKIPALTLSNGMKMPSLGMGTWQLNGENAPQVVRS